MNRHLFALFAGGLAIALAIGVLLSPVSLAPSVAADNALSWQAVKTEVPVGKSVRLEVRLVGAGANPITKSITVTSTRLDMGPDGMETMTAPIRPAASSQPGVLAFDADIVMAGHWALTLAATVEGEPEPVSGRVVFTASDKRSEAAPPPKANAGRKILYYRNPMGLPDVSPVPKKDSMGMDYIPVYEDEASGPAGTVRISLDKVQRAGVRTETVQRRTLARTVRAFGTIVPDESRLAAVTAKFDGFVEELLVPFTGAKVRAGQPLVRVWIESPEILRKQADLLSALRDAGARARGLDRTERNLRLFGIPDQVIEKVKRTGEPIRSIILTAPANGTVMDKPAIAGMRFAAGDTLFRTADLATVWVIARVAERDLALVRIGQTARIVVKAYADAPLEGRITFVYPEVDAAIRTARVRIEVPNPDGRLKVGLYADVGIEAQVADGPVIAVPESAVIDSGTRRVAFVARDGGVFEPRDLVLGKRGDGLVEVRQGLAEGERIVVSGNFLIDAESNLRAALAAFTAPEAPKLAAFTAPKASKE